MQPEFFYCTITKRAMSKKKMKNSQSNTSLLSGAHLFVGLFILSALVRSTFFRGSTPGAHLSAEHLPGSPIVLEPKFWEHIFPRVVVLAETWIFDSYPIVIVYRKSELSCPPLTYIL